MAVKITHEAADMRRHLWVKAPLRVVVDGAEHRAVEWSLGGVAIEGLTFKGDPIGRQLALHLDLPYQGFAIGFDVKGEVEDVDPDTGRAVIGFRGMGQRERELLSHFVDQLVRGTMIPIDETIHRLGAPMPGGAQQAQAAAAQPGAVEQGNSFGRFLRATVMSMFYLAAGTAVLGYLVTLAYARAFWLEVPTAEISAPVETQVSLGDGQLTWDAVKPGDTVKAGTVVVNIQDNVLEREIEQAEITIGEKKNKLDFLTRRKEIEDKRMGVLTGMSGQKNVHIASEIAALRIKITAANAELRRLPNVVTSAPAKAQIRQSIVAMTQQITLKEQELKNRVDNSGQANGEYAQVGKTIVGDAETIAAQIEQASADIDVARQRHQSYVNQRDRLSVRAPFDGVVRAMPRANSSTVKKGDVVAVIEKSQERRVTAYIRQDQMLQIQLGAEALINIPATNKTLKATVAEIEPVRDEQKNSSGQPSHNRSGAGAQETGLATIRLDLNGPQPTDLNVYRDGLPVVTLIKIARTGPLWKTIEGAHALVQQGQNAIRTSGLGERAASIWSSLAIKVGT